MADKITVLIADDMLIGLEGMKSMLENVGEIGMIATADTPTRVLEVAKLVDPNVVLLDQNWLGDTNTGIYLIRELRNYVPNAIIIAITAYPGVLKDAENAGAWAAVTKNLRRQELIELIQEASSSRSKTRKKPKKNNIAQPKPSSKKEAGFKFTQAHAVIVSAILTAIIGGYFALQAATKPVELQIAATQTAEAKLLQTTIEAPLNPSIDITPNATNLAVATIDAPVPGQNLISNASFESEPQGNNPKWNLIKKNSDVIGEWSSRISRNGTHALSLSTAHLNSPFSSENHWFYDTPGWFSSDPIFVAYGHIYTFRVYSYTDNGGSYLLSLEFFNNQGDFIYGKTSGCETTPILGAWDIKEVSINTSEMETKRKNTIKFAQIGLAQCLKFTEGKTTGIYYDDVFFGILDN